VLPAQASTPPPLSAASPTILSRTETPQSASKHPASKPSGSSESKSLFEKSIQNLPEKRHGRISKITSDIAQKSSAAPSSLSVFEKSIQNLPEKRISKLPEKFGFTSQLYCFNASVANSSEYDPPIFPDKYALKTFKLDPNIPRSVKQALAGSNSEKWAAAIDSELDSIQHHDTYSWEPLPKGKTTLKCGYVFKIKPAIDGNPERFKARLVAYGNHQKAGEDFEYEDIFAPVLKYKTLRLTCALAVEHDLLIHKLDVKTAFLNGSITEEIFLEPPPGVKAPYGRENCKWKLHRSLYGLRQSPRRWNDHIHAFLVSMGFTRLESDYGVYVKWTGDDLEIVTVYVDDLLVAAKRLETIQKIKSALMTQYEMTDFGEAKSILGISLHRDLTAGTLILEQSSYIDSVLEKFRCQDASGAPTPLDKDSKAMSGQDSPSTVDEIADMASVPYREAVGSVMHVMVCTRPDIACAVGTLSRYLHNPGRTHWRGVLRVLKYLKSTRLYGLCFRKSSKPTSIIGNLHGFCDSDWATDKDHYLSTAGWVFIMNGAAISWQSKRGKTPAQSSCDAEYVAEGMAAQEICHLRNILSELKMEPSDPIPLYSDSQSAIHLTKNPVFHERSKHAALKLHLSRHLQRDGRMSIQFIPTHLQVADVLTKALHGPKVSWGREKMGLIELPDPIMGGVNI
jgi:hypothetical protein